jgi:hypothetical protein
VRQNALREEFIVNDGPPLAALVRENPRNRMAFEYLIASFLIRRELDSLAGYTAGLRALGYDKIPRLYEEALLLNSALTGKAFDLSGYAISGGTTASFEHFCSICYSKHKGNAGAARNDLAAAFGGSYFFYYLYGFSGTTVPNERN